MLTREIIKAIREFRGDVMVGVLVRDDVIYVKAVKSDLLDAIAELSDGQAYVSEVGGKLYFDRD